MSPTYAGQIKIFSDTADRASLLEAAKNPVIKGMTTNPTLMRRAGVSDYRAFAKDILQHVTDKPISFEVFADDFPNMERQALEIKEWGQNVYVKIPVTNSKGEPATGLIRKLSQSGVKLNVTAILTLQQTLEVCQALRGGAPAFVSVFAGRIADTGRDPVPLMRAALEMCRAAGKDVELLWASSRELLNVVQADEIGCHIITVTQDIIKKLSMINKDLSELSLDTVKMFKTDAEAAGFQL